jgi:hypothetical protein
MKCYSCSYSEVGLYRLKIIGYLSEHDHPRLFLHLSLSVIKLLYFKDIENIG